MRKIKFRKYDTYNKKWEIYDLERIGYDGKINWENDESVGQYTGLKDKNGVEIYEGDIIEFTEVDEDSAFGREETHIVSVEWINDIAQWRCVYKTGQRRELYLVTNFEPVYKCNIIGNIYENPELLK